MELNNPTLNMTVIFGLSIEVYFILLLIAIPTFLFWKWLFKKYIKANQTRKLATYLATLIATPIIYVGLIALFIFGISYEPDKKFNKSQWLANKEERYLMANDIIEEKMLLGKDTNQVKQIVGTPNWKDNTTQQWTYDMGTGTGGLGFLFHNLIVTFNNNKVTAVKHVKIQD